MTKCIFLSLTQDGTEVVVKHVLPGDSVHSLLSILDVITVKPIWPLFFTHSDMQMFVI